MSPAVEFWVTLFLGPFGVHRFMKHQVGMGVLYLCTVGLFGIGWIVDLVKAGRRYWQESRYKKALADKPDYLIPCAAPGLLLGGDETCVYYAPARYVESKNLVTGHVREGGGASVRVVPGVRVGRSTGVSRTIREDVTRLYGGTLYITTKRVVFSGEKGGFDRLLDAISTIDVSPQSVTLQFGGKSYTLMTADSPRCVNVLEGAINGIPLLK